MLLQYQETLKTRSVQTTQNAMKVFIAELPNGADRALSMIG